MKEQSPFSPGLPVPIEYFVGRMDEIMRIERALAQAATGVNKNLFITGERGIGKSSLAIFTTFKAERDFQFLTAHCLLGSTKTVQDVCATIFKQLLQAASSGGRLEKIRGVFGKYISSIDVFGVTVELAKDSQTQEVLVSNFLPLLRQVHDNLRDDRKGLCLVLDDLNGITGQPELALFLKSLVDGIAADYHEKLPLLLVLVGTPERMDDMRSHQPSISRIFEVVELSLMSDDESSRFFERAFSSVGHVIEPLASEIMVKYCGGFPVLLHEVGDAVFWEDRDANVTSGDALFGVGVAAENIGRKYLDRQVYQAIKSKLYRSLLRKIIAHRPVMSSEAHTTITREMLGKASDAEKKNFENFIQKMKKLGVLKDSEERGKYVFTNELYALYMALEAKRESKYL